MCTERGVSWQPDKTGVGLVTRIAEWAVDCERAFASERDLRQQWRIGTAGLEDVVLCGCPGEGHRPAKESHGAGEAWEGDRWVRTVNQAIGYTLDVRPGRTRVVVEVRGWGYVTVGGGERLEFRHSGWERHAVEIDSSSTTLVVRCGKAGLPEPAIRLIAAYRV
jgi:hypothetical protein